jgi:hypothetical protein
MLQSDEREQANSKQQLDLPDHLISIGSIPTVDPVCGLDESQR